MIWDAWVGQRPFRLSSLLSMTDKYGARPRGPFGRSPADVLAKADGAGRSGGGKNKPVRLPGRRERARRPERVLGGVTGLAVPHHPEMKT